MTRVRNRWLVLIAISVLPGLNAFALLQENNHGGLRVALVGLKQPLADQALIAGLSTDSRIRLVDPALTGVALEGFGYDGSINMSTDQARRLAAAIGCDFFIVGKSEVIARSERGGESHREAYAGIMIVDARSGRLALFDFLDEKAASSEAAIAALAQRLAKNAGSYVERIAAFRAASLFIEGGTATGIEPVEVIPDEDSPRAAGFKAPVFLNRVKPEYTLEAELADITATVEASVVFQADGKIGDVEIVRWAGFGLDESSRRAIAQLKFKPATRDGRPLSIRATVRYNFRRVAELPAKPEPEKPPDKPVRDLREILNKKPPANRD